MKKILFATAAVFALSTASYAADLPAAQTYVPEAPVYASTVWSGFYLGVHAGWTHGDFNAKQNGAVIFVDEDDSLSGGFYAGYNHQLMNSNVVLGLEADVTFYSLEGDTLVVGDDLDSSYQASLRARAGYAIDRFLPFVTAGWAFSNIDVTSLAAGGSVDDTHHGFVVGAGLDYAFTQNLIGRLEYNYASFNDKNHNFLTMNPVKAGLDTHTVRVGLAYKF